MWASTCLRTFEDGGMGSDAIVLLRFCASHLHLLLRLARCAKSFWCRGESDSSGLRLFRLACRLCARSLGCSQLTRHLSQYTGDTANHPSDAGAPNRGMPLFCMTPSLSSLFLLYLWSLLFLFSNGPGGASPLEALIDFFGLDSCSVVGRCWHGMGLPLPDPQFGATTRRSVLCLVMHAGSRGAIEGDVHTGSVPGRSRALL